MGAFEDKLAATSTDHAPWHIVPANRKWYRNFVVADRIVEALKDMKLKTPVAPSEINFDTLKIVYRSRSSSADSIFGTGCFLTPTARLY
jgi:hypothetical protein